jgi:uncharacterized protein (DUF2461 family)
MQQRADQQQSDQQIDQLVEKLKELARRQQQEMERQRRMAQAGQSASGSSSAAQRGLADEVEKAARQLQQLTRDQQRQQMNDAMQKLQDAANAMRQAAANGSKDGGAQANQALDRLREAQQRLERNQGSRGDRDLQRAQRQAEELASEQKEMTSEVNGLDQAQAGGARDGKAQVLGQRKEAMDAKVADLQQQLEKLANQMRRDEKDAARKLDEAAGSIRDKRIREKIKYTQRALQQGAGSQQQYARGMEDDIGANLDALQRKIGEAAGSVGKQSKQDSLARAADKTRDLVRGMESLDQRMRDRAQQQGKGQQGNGQQSPSQSQSQSQGGQNGGQQGQQSQSGQNGGGGANNGDNAGSPRNGAYGGDARNWGGGYGYGWRWNPDDIRQFRNQFREWTNDAEALRRQLQQAGVNPRDLEDVLRDLRLFENDRLYADPQGLEKLQAAAIEKLKKVEFALRRKADSGNDSLSLSGSDQVPDGFRQAIEEYYRSLAKKQQR